MHQAPKATQRRSKQSASAQRKSSKRSIATTKRRVSSSKLQKPSRRTFSTTDQHSQQSPPLDHAQSFLATANGLNQAFQIDQVLPALDPMRVVAFETIAIPFHDKSKFNVVVGNKTLDQKLLHSILLNVPALSKHNYPVQTSFPVPSGQTLAPFTPAFLPIDVAPHHNLAQLGLKHLAGFKYDEKTSQVDMQGILDGIFSRVDKPLTQQQAHHLHFLEHKKMAHEVSDGSDDSDGPVEWSAEEEAQLQAYLKKPKFAFPLPSDLASTLQHPLIAQTFRQAVEATDRDASGSSTVLIDLLREVTQAAGYLRKLPSPTHSVIPVYPGPISLLMQKADGAGHAWQYVSMGGGVIRHNLADDSAILFLDDISAVETLYPPMIKQGSITLSARTKQMVDFERKNLAEGQGPTTQGAAIEESIRQIAATTLIGSIADQNLVSPRMSQYLSIFKLSDKLKNKEMKLDEALSVLKERFEENTNIPSATAFLHLALRRELPPAYIAAKNHLEGVLNAMKASTVTYEQYVDHFNETAKTNTNSTTPNHPLLPRNAFDEVISALSPGRQMQAAKH